MADIFGAVKNFATLGAYDANKAIDAQRRAADVNLKSTLSLANQANNRRLLTPPPTTSSAPSGVPSDYFKQQMDILNQIRNMTVAKNREVYAPKLDFAAINAQARQSAENAVNPYYTKALNDFLAQQSAQRQRQESQFSTNISNIDDNLKQTLESNAITKDRTAADTALAQGQINTAADQAQVDSGDQFEEERLAQARDLAQAGVLGSGAGTRKTSKAIAGRNTGEQRQGEQFQEERNKQELFKTRTFEDLARSGELASAGAEKGKKQAKVDLDAYIQDLSFDETNQRNALEEKRLGAIANEQDSQSKLLINNFINSISDPAQRQAAFQAYA